MIKQILSLLVVVCFITGIPGSSLSQEEPVKKRYTLTHHMSPEEKALFHTVGKNYVATDPPPGEIHNIAEYEKMEGVLIGYPGTFGISYELIAGLSEVIPVTTIVETNSQLNYVTAQYEANNVNMDNTVFLVTPLDSYWTRDYGPWFVRYGEDQIGVIDFIYNRPNRPMDNAIPPQIADMMELEWFGMDLITAGGNYMTDGYGNSASSDLTWEENPTMTEEEIDAMLLEYCGISTYHVLPDPNNTYIDHIDCWGKFLDVDKVLIREVPQSHPQYDEIEETAAYFEGQVSAWGNNYQVFRVWTPNNEPYTNSLIVNNTVFLPIMGGQWDDEAVASYEAAMPGYEILTFTGSWESTDALHCRVKGMADRNTLYIEHYPLLGEQDVQAEYSIEATITAYSGEEVLEEDVKVIWWINGVPQDDITMTHEGGKIWSAVLPAGVEGSEMAYFLAATDAGGYTSTHPMIGEPDPHVFYVGEQLFATIAIDVTEISMIAGEGSMAEENIQIANSGDLELNYSIAYSDAEYEEFSYEVEDSPGQFSWLSNTWEELGWVEFNVDDTEGEIADWSITFDWIVDQYVGESTLHVESPGSTTAVIAAGLPDGTYTLNTTAFNGEQMQGTWRIWLTDTYGDGGHQATNITVTITKTFVIAPWLSVEPVSGAVQPGDASDVTVYCTAGTLPVGNYEGTVWVSSNDPDFPTIEIPVYFTVVLASGTRKAAEQEMAISNYPNPFKAETIFEITLQRSMQLSLMIYDVQGQPVKTLIREELSSGTRRVSWDGTSESGISVPKGVYFYRILTAGDRQTGKLILN